MRTRFSRTSILSIILIFVMAAFLFTACGEDESPEMQKEKQEQMQKEQQEKQKQIEKQKKEEKERKKKEKKEAEKKAKEKSSGVPEVYTVKDGETLQRIADRFYGDRSMWYDIFSKNESDIDNWDIILPGQKLKLPQPKSEK